ncbi:MAG TPA: hypothetical protein VLD66_02400, partial [Methyloceanibacter sp.]|nr:hypothetical protein [Methyloceanibacter sp.]
MKALNCHTMRAAVSIVPLIVCLFGGAGIAAAQQPTPEQQDAIRSNCRSDFMANCSGVPRGGKEAMQCLKDNVAKLSSGCQQAVKAVMPAPAPKPPTPPVTATPAAPAAPPPAAAPAAPVAATPAAPAPAAPAAVPAASPATQAAAKPAAPASSTPSAAAKPAAVKPAAPSAPAAKSAAKPPAGATSPVAAPPAVIVVAPIQVFALVRTKCRAEYRAYCSDVDIGGGRVV